MIYLDNAATTQIDPLVIEVMVPYITEQYGNPGSLYKLGRDARAAVERAREQVAQLIGARPDQIIFTSGATEANNMVFEMVRPSLIQSGKTHIITSSIEHKSVLRPIQRMVDEHGFDATYIGLTKDFTITPENVLENVRQNTGLVSIMFSNNEIGASSYMHEIGNVREENDWLFHTDCVQAAGHFAIDVVRAGCDFATISSHKIHGPKGVGALFIKDPGRWNPMVLGGTDQEFGLRGGTENVAGIVGFGQACEIAHAYMNSHEYCKMRLMKSAFSERLKQKLHSSGVADLIHSNGCLDCTKTMSFRVDGVDAESLILMADNAGVCISAGSACNSRENIPSHVLTAIGLNSQEARSSFRVSFSRMNTVDEARVAAEIIADCIVALLSTGCDG